MKTHQPEISMANFTAKTQRSIKAYGINVCRNAFRMHEADGASDVGAHLNMKTRQAGCDIEAGREIFDAEKLTVRAYLKAGGSFTFVVSADEWRAELPSVMDCYSRPVREYQQAACVKKAQALGLNMATFQIL